MNLLKAQQLCLQLMNQHGLTKEKGWSFEWINSKRTAGKCRTTGSRKVVGRTWRGNRIYVPTGTTSGGVIMLSKFITEHHDEAKVTDTILHEIAHGLTPGHNHDHVWRMKAIFIGCNGERCYEANDSEELITAKEKASKVIGTCPKCDNKFFMTRMPKRDQWCKCTMRRFIQSEKINWVSNGSVPKPAVLPKPVATPRVPIVAARGFQRFAAHSSFSDTLLQQSPDSYKKMLDNFEMSFLLETSGDIDRNIFENIVREAKKSSSWRTMNREVRKACDKYCEENGIMSHRQFQEKYFYEGVMIGRMSWGKNAPWL